MSIKVQAVPLSKPRSESTVVKSVSLFTFRALRAVAGYVAELPTVASQAASDVQEAWRESSRPNA